MKFPTQHKRFIVTVTGSRRTTYGAHRQSNKVWVSEGANSRTVAQRAFKYVAQAKAWMNSPSILALK